MDTAGKEVIAIVSLSRHATSTYQVERLVESIRGIGEYRGNILLITDYPDDYTELQKTEANFVVFEPDHSMIICRHASHMTAKRLKTSLIDIVFGKLNLQSVEVILYVDMDVVVGSPLLPFFNDVGQMLTKAGTNATMIAQGQGNSDQPYHGGVFALNRHSEECLLLWRKFIDESTVNRDQKALGHALQTTSGCTFKPFSVSYVNAPTPEYLVEGKRQVFVHITNTHRAHILDKKAQLKYFTEVLNITKTPIFSLKVPLKVTQAKNFSIPSLCIK